eukprot:s2176_g12.t6
MGDLLICDIRWQGTRNATHIGLFFSASEFSDCLRVWPLSQLFNPKMTCQEFNRCRPIPRKRKPRPKQRRRW